jgi:hypothetical protein
MLIQRFAEIRERRASGAGVDQVTGNADGPRSVEV